MNVTEASKISADPSFEKTVARIESAAKEQGKLYDNLSRWSVVKIAIGKGVHPLGIHTWVTWRHYDGPSGRILDMPGVICAYCMKARYG